VSIIPFGAPEDAYDTSMDNYLAECAYCHEPAMRDDLDENRICDTCLPHMWRLSEPADPTEDRREAIADAAYHDAKGV